MKQSQSLPARPLILAVRFYQATLGVYLGGHCRFAPSCSQYAIDALQTKGAMRGSWLAMRRILRCHPLGGAGYDPVPGAEVTPPAVPGAEVTPPAEPGAKG